MTIWNKTKKNQQIKSVLYSFVTRINYKRVHENTKQINFDDDGRYGFVLPPISMHFRAELIASR